MRDRLTVYISGPISNGGTATPEERLENVRKAVTVFLQLVERGFSPMCPQLTEYVELLSGQRLPHETWMEIDMPWVRKSDILFRMEGPSTGADMEVNEARRHGIPVVFSLEELTEQFDWPAEELEEK